jgi:hypothetical protein
MHDVAFLRCVFLRSTIAGVGIGFTDRGPGSPTTLGYVFIYATLDTSELSKSQVLHIKIAQLDKVFHVPLNCRKCRIFPTTFASVASWSLVSQMMFRHIAVIMTLRRHL